VNIGKAAQASGVSAKMIRYYEAVGLMAPVARTQAGYRRYTAPDIHTLRFIQGARGLGFSVAEIQDLLDLWRDHTRKSADVKRLAQQHIATLEARIDRLRQMRDTLQSFAQGCAGDDRPDCPILCGLQRPTNIHGRYGHLSG